MHIKEKLAKLVAEGGRGTKAELARALGVPSVYITRWTSMDYVENIPREYYVPIAKFFNTDPSIFLDTDDSMELLNIKFVPIVGEASCGLPITNSYQEKGKKTPYMGKFWNKNLYGLIACGNSMAPDIEDGDEVVCDPTADILDGDIVHYRFMGESAIKIFHDNIELNAIEFIPYNQSPEFKIKSIRRDDDFFGELNMSKVVSINKLKLNNRKARLRLVGRA
ncbi:LexA family transcriptional regulator [uncultured Campylobacter sp.]|uniref:LexA family transcriptional regulator n=1 Tax=uncultured Campylobacter sp. TaxID=218934 RepID=UPI00260676AB|nr:LexA family transcriptional regulator [uncultured Campylobacter sp.]